MTEPLLASWREGPTRDVTPNAGCPTPTCAISYADVPIREPSAIAVAERLPPGAAAALLNQAHTHSDLVMLVGEREHRWWESIDGDRSIEEIGGDTAFFARLFEHDLIVIDSSSNH